MQLIKEEPKPIAKREEPAPEPVPVPEPALEPAPAPKALAERRSMDFAPQAQAVAPQIVNPTVVAQASPQLNAQKLEMNQVAAVVVGRHVERIGQQAHHHAFLGFAGVLRQREDVVAVDAAVHVGDLQLHLVDGGFEGHDQPAPGRSQAG